MSVWVSIGSLAATLAGVGVRGLLTLLITTASVQDRDAPQASAPPLLAIWNGATELQTVTINAWLRSDVLGSCCLSAWW